MAEPRLDLRGLTMPPWKGTPDTGSLCGGTGPTPALRIREGNHLGSGEWEGDHPELGEALEFIFSLMNASESVLSLIPFLERWKL